MSVDIDTLKAVKISRRSPPACGRGNRASRTVPPEEDLPVPPGTGIAINLGVQMEDLTHTNNFVCVDGEPCRLYKPGHHTHSIHWRQAHRTREHFRDAIVREVDGHHVTVEFVDGGSETYWNHEDLPSLLSSGDPVGVHSEFHLLIAGFKALNLANPADL